MRLLHSFYDSNYVIKLPIKNITRLLNKAFEKHLEKMVWERWLAIYPYMELKHIEFKSFEDFKNVLLKKPVKTSNKSAEEIESEMMGIIKNYEKRTGK